MVIGTFLNEITTYSQLLSAYLKSLNPHITDNFPVLITQVIVRGAKLTLLDTGFSYSH